MEEREVILFGRQVDWGRQPGRCIRFKAHWTALKRLLDGGFVDANERQNDNAPTLAEIARFAEAHNGDIEGYLIGPMRADSRVSVDAVVVPIEDAKVLCTFGGTADEITMTAETARAWWD